MTDDSRHELTPEQIKTEKILRKVFPGLFDGSSKIRGSSPEQIERWIESVTKTHLSTCSLPDPEWFPCPCGCSKAMICQLCHKIMLILEPPDLSKRCAKVIALRWTIPAIPDVLP